MNSMRLRLLLTLNSATTGNECQYEFTKLRGLFAYATYLDLFLVRCSGSPEDIYEAIFDINYGWYTLYSARTRKRDAV